jgi:hypothetical protein
MKNGKQTISIESARLIIGYLHNSLTDPEKNALDEWICLSDENMEIFGELTRMLMTMFSIPMI